MRMKKGEASRFPFPLKPGAGDESRTRDLNLGKVALYQLSYSRVKRVRIIKTWRGMSRKFLISHEVQQAHLFSLLY